MQGHLGAAQCRLLLKHMTKIISALPEEDKWRGEQVWEIISDACVHTIQVDMKQMEAA